MVDNDRHVACDVGLLCLMAAYQLLLLFHPGRRIRTPFLSHTLIASHLFSPQTLAQNILTKKKSFLRPVLSNCVGAWLLFSSPPSTYILLFLRLTCKSWKRRQQILPKRRRMSTIPQYTASHLRRPQSFYRPSSYPQALYHCSQTRMPLRTVFEFASCHTASPLCSHCAGSWPRDQTVLLANVCQNREVERQWERPADSRMSMGDKATCFAQWLHWPAEVGRPVAIRPSCVGCDCHCRKHVTTNIVMKEEENWKY